MSESSPWSTLFSRRRLAIGAKAAARQVVDAILPPRCLACPEPVDTQGLLCSGCWSAFDFIARPFCARCGYPFDYEQGEAALCAACAGRPPAFATARALFRYRRESRDMILDFKHGDRLEAGPALGRLLAALAEGQIDRQAVVTPVPLHRSRLFARRYNQSAILARAVATVGQGDYCADALERIRPTPSQAGRNRRQRFRNVAAAFRVRERRQERVSGRPVWLIDDVMTTGATLESCARSLLRGGARAVHCLTLARVVLPRTLVL